MNKRYEEDVIRLAFQDCSEAESKAIRERVGNDPEAQKLLETYSRMRETLREMPIVEHQLSTDRLRQAILNRGLTHEAPPSTPFWRWAWMPAAAVIGAFLLTNSLSRFPGTGEPILTEAGTPAGSAPVVLNAPGGEPPSISAALPAPPAAEPSRPLDSAPVGPSTGPVAAASRNPAPVGRIASGTRTAETAARLESAPAGTAKASAARASGPATDAAVSAMAAPAAADPAADAVALAARFPVEAVASSVRTYVQNSEPIVLVGTDVDRDTGAKRAIEVTSPSNVVIGS
ncbi:MAG: hypothetical protein SNJ74_09145 [Fimbriimonadaceae bacterium]